MPDINWHLSPTVFLYLILFAPVKHCRLYWHRFLYTQDFWPQYSTSTQANQGKAPGICLIWPAFHKVKRLWSCPCVWGFGSFWAQVAVLNKQDYLSWLCVSKKPSFQGRIVFLVWCRTPEVSIYMLLFYNVLVAGLYHVLTWLLPSGLAVY